jgi:hypothetical protein
MNHSFPRNFWISLLLWIVFTIFADGFEKPLLLSIFLLIPLLLFLVPIVKRDGTTSTYHSFLLGYHPYAACTIGIAFLFPTGELTTSILSIPWSIYLIAIAGYGIRRWFERGWYVLEESAIDMGLIYAPIGGIILNVYSFGGSFFGIPPNQLLPLASLFHFSAIFAPAFIGFTGRLLCEGTKVRSLYRFTAIGLMISPLLLLIGYLTTTIVHLIVTTIYISCLIFYCYYLFVHISQSAKRKLARVCIQVSAISGFLAALSLLVFSISVPYELNLITNTTFGVVYGLTNIFGFIALGTIGWIYLKPEENASLYGLPSLPIRSGTKTIDKDFLERNALVDTKQAHAGLVDNLEKFARTDFIPAQIHPKIRSFFENTMLYDINAQVKWEGPFWIIGKIVKNRATKIRQLNLPENETDIVKLDSKIIAVNIEEQFWNKKLRAWIRTYKSNGQTMLLTIYSDHQHENEHYLHVTLPTPTKNFTGILRMEHGSDERLQVTSLPRRGRKGDEGLYWMTKKMSIRLPLNEHFFIWVDEYGRLQATYRMWLFGLKLLNIEYEISGKVR